jgi:hypothetical protein
LEGAYAAVDKLDEKNAIKDEVIEPFNVMWSFVYLPFLLGKVIYTSRINAYLGQIFPPNSSCWNSE